MVMDEIVEAFVQAPSEALLDGSTRDQLVKIAAHYKVDVGDKRVKETVKANLKLKLSKMNVLSAGEAASVSAGNESATPPLVVGLDAGLSFEQQKELLVLRMQLETEKEVAVERVRQSIEQLSSKCMRWFLKLIDNVFGVGEEAISLIWSLLGTYPLSLIVGVLQLKLSLMMICGIL